MGLTPRLSSLNYRRYDFNKKVATDISKLLKFSGIYSINQDSSQDDPGKLMKRQAISNCNVSYNHMYTTLVKSIDKL